MLSDSAEPAESDAAVEFVTGSVFGREAAGIVSGCADRIFAALSLRVTAFGSESA